MANKTYEIIISLKSADGAVSKDDGAEESSSENFLTKVFGKVLGKWNLNKSEVKQSAVTIAKQTAQKAANVALSSFGNITGDYTTQQNIQTAISEGSALASAVTGGPVAMATYVVDKGLQIFENIAQNKRSEAAAAFKQQRVYAVQNKA